MNCNFSRHGNNWICNNCGRTKPYNETVSPPIAICRKSPPIITKIKHFSSSIIRFIEGGCKVRTDKDVERLLVICHNCDRYENIHKSCSICGCNCNSSNLPFINKLKMATERCPLGKWE